MSRREGPCNVTHVEVTC